MNEKIKNHIKSLLLEKLAFYIEGYEDSSVLFTNVFKNGIPYESVIVRSTRYPDICPAVPMNQLEEIYNEDADKNDYAFLKIVGSMFCQSLKSAPEKHNVYKQLKKECIIFCVMNANKKEYLSQVPHRLFLDLAVTYRITITDGKFEGSIPITTELMKYMGITTEEELFEFAKNNTEDILGFRSKTICDIFLEMGIEDERIFDYPKFRQVTTKYSGYASSALLCLDYLSYLAFQMGGPIYILPSSVNDLVAISTSYDVPVNKLRQMIREVNRTSVSDNEYLSDSLYHFDPFSMKLTIVTE